MRYDLLLKQGLVIDPGNNRHEVMDIAVHRGRVAAVQADIPAEEALEVLDVRGLIVTPGLIDAHLHVYTNSCDMGVHTDKYCVSSGVTTACDAGSTGALNFPGLRELLTRAIRTRFHVFLNFSLIGITGVEVSGELADRRFADSEACIRTIAGNRDLIKGIKLRVGPGLTWDPHEALQLARQTADAAQVPLMVHVTNSPIPLSEVLGYLQRGDVLTHPFHGFTNGILNPDRTAILKPIWEAQERGVLFDSAHGRMGHFNFDVVRKAIGLGFMPDLITTDLSIPSATRGPVFNLVTTMSKFLNFGMSLQDIIWRTTAKPAEHLGVSADLGHLGVGAIADIAVLELQEGAFEFMDTDQNVITEQRRLVAVYTLRDGRVCYRKGEDIAAANIKPRTIFD